jgi:hypothetical protein
MQLTPGDASLADAHGLQLRRYLAQHLMLMSTKCGGAIFAALLVPTAIGVGFSCQDLGAVGVAKHG